MKYKKIKLSPRAEKCELDFHEKLRRCYKTEEDMLSSITSIFGMAFLLGDYILSTHEHPILLPPPVLYPLLQIAQIKKVFGEIANGNGEASDKIEMQHMEVGEGAWESDEDFEARMGVVVEALYEIYKAKGRISS